MEGQAAGGGVRPHQGVCGSNLDAGVHCDVVQGLGGKEGTAACNPSMYEEASQREGWGGLLEHASAIRDGARPASEGARRVPAKMLE